MIYRLKFIPNATHIFFLSRLTRKKRHLKSDSHPPLSFRPILYKFAWQAVGVFVAASVGFCVLFRWLPLPTTAFMLNRHVEDFRDEMTFKPIDYRWVGAKKISPAAYQAVIASEDQRFFEHRGFDFHAIQAAVDNYFDGRRLRGASTISQQVAKNLFLSPSKSFLRKGFEVWFTLLLEMFWSKERILTVYLNIAEFGDHLFGVEAASRRYFGVPASKLSRAQAALLAATLPNPFRLKAALPSSYVHARQQWILRQMRHVRYPR
jgi:monofunctional biosynthetic peptidoglycan transglycosylase